AARPARASRAMHGRRALRRRRPAHAGTPSAAAGPGGGAGRRPRAGRVPRARALGRDRALELFGPALPRAPVPHAARPGAVVLRVVFQPPPREDAAAVFRARRPLALRPAELD